MAQYDKPAESIGAIQFYLDKAVFQGSNGAFTEFYLMFYADRLKYNENGTGEIVLSALITDNTGNEIQKKDWSVQVNVSKNDTSLSAKVFYDQWNTYLKPGDYKIIITASDKYSPASKGELNAIITIPEIKEQVFSGSEIEFVSSVSDNAALMQFKKGNSVFIPNPSRRFGLFNKSLLFYYEVYGVSPGNNYKTVYSIVKSGSRIYSKNIKSVFNSTKNAVVYGIDVSEVPSGVYDLSININDESGTSIALSRAFEIIQADVFTQKSKVTPEEDGMYSALITYLEPEQLSMYKSLDAKAKGSFIVQFWKEHDPTPGTAINEYMSDIQKRFVYAEQNFGWAGIKGWQTDMGRICIKYGIPDEIQQNNSEADYLPYEIWYYRLKKEYQFVFADLQSNGRFILVHSDKEGEVSNTSWKQLIRKM